MNDRNIINKGYLIDYKRKKWTEPEINLLKNLYEGLGLSCAECSFFIKKSKEAVNIKVVRLKLRHNKNQTASIKSRNMSKENNPMYGIVCWNKGLNKYTSESLSRTSKALSEKGKDKRRGYSYDWTKKLRNFIRKRDNYKCVMCDKTQKENKYNLDVHHIDGNKLNSDMRNLVSLCKSCHTTVHNNPKFNDYIKKYYIYCSSDAYNENSYNEEVYIPIIHGANLDYLEKDNHETNDFYLENNTLKTKDKTKITFKKYPLNILSYAILISEFNFDCCLDVKKIIYKINYRVLKINKVEISDALDKILLGKNPKKALDFLQETDVIKYLEPNLALQWEYDQNSKYHKLDLWNHTMTGLDYLVKQGADLNTRLAFLYHDIGKPHSMIKKFDKEIQKEVHGFHKHDLIGCEMIKTMVAPRLKWSKERTRIISELVLNHMRDDSPLKEADMNSKGF